MDKKGFSLLEIIFVLLTISVIVTVAVSKFDLTLNSTNLTKIKADILQIRAGINLYKNEMILKNEDYSFNSLGDSDTMLFNKVIQTPIIASDTKDALSWSKISNTKYKVYIDNSNALEFVFNTTKLTFECDTKETLCKKLDL